VDRSRAAAGTTLSLAITPMIDVIFLLLVFFICTVRFERREETIRADLPARGATADPLALASPPLLIEVGRRIANAPAITLTSEAGVSSVESTTALATRLAELCRRDGSNGLYEPSHRVLVSPARDASWDDAVGAFDAAARAGFTDIGFGEHRP
jgi:biopolymer transport protein ExbD